MQPSIRYRTAEHAPTDYAENSRLRTVAGNRFPRKCACGCGRPIPRDASVRAYAEVLRGGRRLRA